MQILKEYSNLFTRHWPRYVVGVGALLLTNALYLWIPRILGAAVDSLREGTTQGELLRYALVISLIAFLQTTTRVISRVFVLGISRRVDYELKGRLHGKLLALAPSFYHAFNTGDLMSRMTNDVMLVRALAGPGFLYFVNAIVIYVMAIVFMVVVNPLLTLIVFIPLPFTAWIVRGLSHRIRDYALASRRALSEINTVVQENLTGIHVVKAFALEAEQNGHFEERSTDYVGWAMKEAWARAQMVPLVGLMGGLAYVGVIGVGGGMVARGELSLGDLVAFLSYVGMLVFPTMAFGWILSLMQRGAAAMERLDEILKAPVTIGDEEGTAGTTIKEGALAVRELSFHYADALEAYDDVAGSERGKAARQRRAALEAISLEAAPGDLVALVGRVGSGKSTLLKALLRLIEVPPGRVFIDGVDITEVGVKELRRAIAFVPQDDFLFSAPLRDNIAFSIPEASDARVREIVEIVGLTTEIDGFPRGLDTDVGERGLLLSGGQRQRVALARALLVEASVLVLDNALSQVDTETERAILGSLSRGPGHRTVIASSNRITAVKDADRIYVMDGGSIVDSGTHGELAARPGLYAMMHEQQQLSARLEEL